MLRDGRAVCHMNALHAAIRFQVIPSPLRTTAYSMDVCIAGLLSVASTPLARPALLVCSESQGCEALTLARSFCALVRRAPLHTRRAALLATNLRQRRWACWRRRLGMRPYTWRA